MVLGESIGTAVSQPKLPQGSKGLIEAAGESTEAPAAEHNLSEHWAVDIFVGAATPLDSFIETVIHWTVGKLGVATIIKAKEEFFVRTGKIFTDDEYYHQRMHYFLNTFLFDRPLSPTSHATPFTSFQESSLLPSLIDGHLHSLFKVTKSKAGILIVRDLFADKKIKIQRQDQEMFEGITKGDVFQGFLLQQGANAFLSRGLIFHPAPAHKVIARMLKTRKDPHRLEKDEILYQLARKQLKHRRLKHVDPKLVYLENSL